MNTGIPAGLVPGDMRLEIFNDPRNREIAYGIMDGRVRRINDLCPKILTAIDIAIASDPIINAALEQLGYYIQEAKREKWASCGYGPLDGQADFEDGKFHRKEFWLCPKRITCPVAGVICAKLTVGDGKVLTLRETQILIHIAQGKLNKEIAGLLGTKVNTVNNQVTAIQRKTGLQNKKELISLAFINNLHYDHSKLH